MRKIVIPFVLLLSLSACGGSKKKVDPKPTPSVEPTSSVAPTSEPVEPTSPVPSPSETVEPSSITTDVTPTIDDYGYDNYDGYYGKLTWTDGEDLKSKLHDIISKDITYVPYSSSPTNWETNQYADQSLYDHDLVDVVYGNDDEFKTATYSSGAGWQREHAFCASLMTGYDTGPAAGAGAGRAVDWHNLFASNNSGNSSRGNKNFGIADTTSSNYIISPNNYSSDERNFEPSDYDKGRLARAIFYMGVMYNEEETETVKTAVTGSQSHDGTHTFTAKYKPLTIQEECVPYSKIKIKDYFESENEDIVAMRNKYGNSDEGYANYSYENCSFAIGNLSTLLNWNEMPVDHLEYQHNESVYSHVNSISGTAQGNRNPFVDYPDLVSYVYGDKQDEAGDLRYIEPTSHRLAVDSKINIHHFAIQDAIRTYEVGDTFDNSCYTLLAVYNDLSEVQALEKYDLTKPYIFTESDVGSKVVQINTVLGAISLKVNVIGSNPKNYTYYTDNDKANGGQLHTDVVGKTFTANKPVSVNVGGLTVNITTENTVTVGNSSTGGLNIGSANGVRAGKVTLTAEVEDVTAIAIEFGAGSNKNFSVSGTIGTTSIIKTQTLTGKGANNMLSVNPKFETPLSGAMSITFSGLSEANSAFYLRMIAIDTK